MTDSTTPEILPIPYLADLAYCEECCSDFPFDDTEDCAYCRSGYTTIKDAPMWWYSEGGPEIYGPFETKEEAIDDLTPPAL